LSERVAILLDGGFVKKKLQERLNHFPSVGEIVDLTSTLMTHARLQGKDLFRVYYYDAPPFEGTGRNPIGGAVLNFSATPQAAQNRALIDSLELQPDFAVRRGTIVQTGWKLGRAALRSLARNQRTIAANDLVPDMAQKGVDIRIGLDIAWISLKRVADILVLVTGDSDFVPVMKFARKEGLKVYVETLGHGVRRELKAHADFAF
jgi:uncharacterized LabA/DUF88 family protein